MLQFHACIFFVFIFPLCRPSCCQTSYSLDIIDYGKRLHTLNVTHPVISSDFTLHSLKLLARNVTDDEAVVYSSS